MHDFKLSHTRLYHSVCPVSPVSPVSHCQPLDSAPQATFGRVQVAQGLYSRVCCDDVCMHFVNIFGRTMEHT